MIFSEEKVNHGRQPEIDCLKAFCIIPMIFLHTFEEMAECESSIKLFLQIIESFSGAAAFMICMGLGSRYSRHQSPRDYLLRGFEIFTLGQLLYLLRDSIPSLIAYRITDETLFLAHSLLIIVADIMSFAGLAFILLALLTFLKLKESTILGIGLIMNAAAFILSKCFMTTGIFILDQILGYFIVTRAEAYFSLSAYFVFVAFGYAIGGLYQRINDKDALSISVVCICLPIVIVYYGIRMNISVPILPEFFSAERYVMNPLSDAWVNCLSALSLIAVFYRLLKLGSGNAPKFVSHLSKHINSYYCMSYVFITPVALFMMAITGERVSNPYMLLLYGLFVLVLCSVLIELNERYFHIGITTLKGKKRAVVFSIIWIATILIVLYAYPQLTEYATVWNDYLM